MSNPVIKHQKNVTIPDGTDTDVVRPSDWNADHQITQTTGRLLGRVSAGTGATEELTPEQSRTLMALGTAALVDAEAANISYSNATSGLDATDLQAAVDEVAATRWELIETATASSSATVDFTNLPTDYIAFRLLMEGVAPASDDVSLIVRFGTGATPTWQNSNYDWQIWYGGSGGGRAGSGSTATGGFTTGIGLTAADSPNRLGNQIAEAWCGEILVQQMHATNLPTVALFNGRYGRPDGSRYLATGSGEWITTTAVTGIRLLMGGGNIDAGTFRLYGLRSAS